jgi:hypothetical protein
MEVMEVMEVIRWVHPLTSITLSPPHSSPCLRASVLILVFSVPFAFSPIAQRAPALSRSLFDALRLRTATYSSSASRTRRSIRVMSSSL